MEQLALRKTLRAYYRPATSGAFAFPAWHMTRLIVGSGMMITPDEDEEDDNVDQILSTHASAELSRHEFAIRATNPNRNQEFMRRFLSVHSTSTLIDAICPSSNDDSAIPTEVHLGARFELVRDARGGRGDRGGKPIGRWALTFDFDITDNPLLAPESKGQGAAGAATHCDRWWKVVAFWCRLMRERLKHDFGFHNTLCVYTGNRGAHLHVLDARAHAHDDATRSAIASFYMLSPHKSNVPGKLFLPQHLHPVLAEMYERNMKPFFLNCMLANESDGGLALLSKAASRTATLALIDNEQVREAIGGSWRTACTRNLMKRTPIDSLQLWQTLTRTLQSRSSCSNYADIVERSIIFSWCWPRIDYGVTAQTNHLSRLPFTPHPKTSRVSIPVDLDVAPGAEDEFHPSDCPTLAHAGVLRSSLPPRTERNIRRGVHLLKKAHTRQRSEVVRQGAPTRASQKRSRGAACLEELCAQNVR